MTPEFRLLNADEIEIRVGTVREGKGISLLLYKDARVDQRLLDEIIGPMNWQKSYELIDGQLFCTVSIWDEEKLQWISKQDVGIESYTEKEKGRASDAQKRAAFCWGIGRELYTAPFIWITPDKGSKTDRYGVEKIVYENGEISGLSIKNLSTNKRIFVYQKEKN